MSDLGKPAAPNSPDSHPQESVPVDASLEGEKTGAATPAEQESVASREQTPADAESSSGTESKSMDSSESTDSSGATSSEEVGAAEAPSTGQAVAEGKVGESGPQDGKTSKKKRKRKKKKASGNASGNQGPFASFFANQGGKKHGFSVGEVIAGRIESVSEASILVDLFGKAQAVVDAYEPVEIPEAPAAPAEATGNVGDAADAAVTDKAAAGVESDAAAAETLPNDGSDAQSNATNEPVQGEASDQVAGDHGTATPVEDVSVEVAATGADASNVPTPQSTPSPQDQSAEGQDAGAAPQASLQEEAGVEGSAPEVGGAEQTDAVAVSAEGEANATGESSDDKGKPEASPAPDPLEGFDPSTYEPSPMASEAYQPQVGGIYRGRVGAVAESGHVVVVHRLVDERKIAAYLEWRRSQGQRVNGLVFGFNRGGFDVLVEGCRAFCPAAAMSLDAVTDPQSFVGQKLEFTVSPPRDAKHGVVVGRRSILEKEARKAAKERIEQLSVGEKLQGKVTQIKDYGLFVDIGGAQGLVHMSELSWRRGLRPADVAQIGQEVDVQVLEIHPPSKKDRTGRVSLSMRAVQADPLDTQSEQVFAGAAMKGKVVRTAEFGAFVEIAPEVEGLLHISELGKGLQHADQAVKVGDEVAVAVDRVDKKNRRISLSKLSDQQSKDLEAGTLEIKPTVSLKPGSRVKVLVMRVEHKGLQVAVVGTAGRRGRGFLSNRDLGAMEGDKRKSLSQGSTLEAKIVGVDRDGSLKFSIRALEFDEERKAMNEYRKEASSQGLGTFGDLLKSKLGIQDQ